MSLNDDLCIYRIYSRRLLFYILAQSNNGILWSRVFNYSRDNKKITESACKFTAAKYKFSNAIVPVLTWYTASTFQFYLKLFNLMVGFILYLEIEIAKDIILYYMTYLCRLDDFGCNGRVTDIRRSHVIKVSSSVDDWQLNVLRNPVYRPAIQLNSR